MARKKRRPQAPDYYEDLADALLEEFAKQDLSLSAFCAADVKWPSVKTVWKWMHEVEGFKEKVDVAREQQLERMMYGSVRTLAEVNPLQGGPGDAAAIVAQYKGVAELTQKLAAKMVPRKFCERFAVEMDGKLTGRVQVTIAEADLEEVDESVAGKL